MSNKYQKSIYNLVHLSKAPMGFDGIYIDSKQLTEDIEVLWELHNKYQELVYKATPKKPIIKNVCNEVDGDVDYGACPNCEYPLDYSFNYCPECGQKLDWSKENVD